MKASVTAKHRAYILPSDSIPFQKMVDKVKATLPRTAPDTVVIRPEAKVIILDTRFIPTLLLSHALRVLNEIYAVETDPKIYW